MVLVVEDDRATRELLAAVLEAEHLAYHMASNGHEALAYARQWPPAMLVLDLHLPSVSGESVGAAFRIEYGSAFPILAMSASYEHAAAERIGAFDYLQKPFDLDALVAKVRDGLGLAARSAVLRDRSLEARNRLKQALARQRQTFNTLREAEPPPHQAAAQ
jgi:DNA-binding response OmpR family regulator